MKKSIDSFNSHEIEIVDYGYILPWRHKVDSFGYGGVLDSEKKFVESSKHVGWQIFGSYYDFQDFDFYDDTVIYIGNITSHWGHFLLDDIGRCWVLNLISKDMNIKIAYTSSSDKLHSNEVEFFNLLGIDENHLSRIKKPSRFKRIFIPKDFKSEINYDIRYYETIKKVVENSTLTYLNNETENTKGKKIYLSRTHFSEAKNKEFGEIFIENYLRDKGFRIIHPEELSLSEQIFIWNNAKEIVSINGTIPLNSIFCLNENVKIVILNKTHLHHKNMDDIINITNNHNYKYIDVFHAKLGIKANYLGQGPFVIEITNDFLKYFDDSNYTLKFTEKLRYNLKMYVFYYRFISLKVLKFFLKKIIKR